MAMHVMKIHCRFAGDSLWSHHFQRPSWGFPYHSESLEAYALYEQNLELKAQIVSLALFQCADA